jgi:phosphoglycerol transferase MdoB-like AlkP superfamily enzyme
MRNLKSLFVKLLVAYFIYAICRLLFLAYNFSYFNDFSYINLTKALLIGLRFDTVAIVYTNILFIVLYTFPSPFKNNHYYQQFLKWLFVFTNCFAALFNIIDVGYFQFSGKRSGVEIFSMQKDATGQIGLYISQYWYFVLLLALLAFITAKLYDLSAKPQNTSYSAKVFLRELLIFIGVAGLCFIGARNSFALKPLNTLDASRLTQPELASLTLNTPFQLLMTVQQQGISEKKYMPEAEVTKYFNPIHQYEGAKPTKKNIVLIIVESLGKEYVGYYNNGKGYTPFLDSLMQHSTVFTNAYANGKRSIEGIPSIIASMPSLMDNDYMNSYYQGNYLQSAGSYLQQIGYDVSFYHGGKNGTMSFDNFIANTHAGNYFGLNEYPTQSDFDGQWGIFDDAYLQYVSKQLSATPQPFFSSVFTLSSHHPFSVPANKTGMFKEGSLPIHKTIRFTDYALQQFFAAAKQTEWYQNTLFIITADHSSTNEQPKYASIEGMYRIPLCVYSPKNPKHDTIISTTQQLDILPMVLKYAGYTQPFFSFGNSYDSIANTNGFAIQYINKVYQFIQYPYVLHFDGENIVAFYEFNAKDEMVKSTNEKRKTEMANTLKAILQQYSFDLIHNKTSVRK